MADDTEDKPNDNLVTGEDSSLSLSLTPPIIHDTTPKPSGINGSDDSISEHLTSNTGSSSIENDRSFQEIEISSQPNYLPSVERLSQELQPNFVIDSSTSENVISLNILNVNRSDTYGSDRTNNVRSILEEIINNEQFNNYEQEKSSVTPSNDDISLNIFAGVDLDDKSITRGYQKRDSVDSLKVPVVRSHISDVDNTVKSLEDILAVKDVTISALNSELDSLKEISHTNSSSMVSATEYKQLQEEYHSKYLEYNSAIIFKNDLIKQLSESLKQTDSEHRELIAQVEVFKEEIAHLQEQLKDTSKLVKNHKCGNEGNDLLNNCSNEQNNAQNQLTVKLEEEIAFLKDKMKSDKEEYEIEIKRLRDLLENIKCGSTEIVDLKNELNAQHSREMEDLRTYFEKKCAELEKNYSEEVFSQQSRKMSASTCSEPDLNSDPLLSNPPGPGGDAQITTFTLKEQLLKLKNDLSSIMNKLDKCDLENINEEEINVLRIELNKCGVETFLRSGRGDGDFCGDEQKHVEESQVVDRYRPLYNTSSAVQEVGSSGEFEIHEFIESYEKRLQEQVAVAKIDFISLLEAQIQRLASNEADDEEWPSELLQLRDRFVDKYEMEIQILKEEHQNEISMLKEEHAKQLNGALERARRRSLRDSLGKGELELCKERDTLKKQVVSLRNLLAELVTYFTQCEDELNNTLVDELLKHGFDKNVSQISEDELNLNESSISTKTNESFYTNSTNDKRVRLAPNLNDVFNLIEGQNDELDSSKDISIELKNELGICLAKLRQDANAILAASVNFIRNDGVPEINGATNINNTNREQHMLLASINRPIEGQDKEKIQMELDKAVETIDSLTKENEKLEAELDLVIVKANLLEDDLKKAKDKVAELVESGRKEIVSEGYGEDGQPNLPGFEDTIALLNELQDKARSMLTQSRSSADPNVLQLIEELCRVGEKIKEDSKKERNDLLQQIDAADKKYKNTQHFLEEQAMEREQERDDAQKKIDQLYEHLREKEKEMANYEAVMSEVEQLEQQIQDLTKHLSEENDHCKEIELERNEAIEKIKILRDIIRELEVQNEHKTDEIRGYQETVEKLECIVEQQQRSLDELKPLVSLKDVSDIQDLRRHVNELEVELQNLRINAELAGNEGTLEQIKLQLFELEVSLDKKTKDLEVLHSTGTNSCSSPSEDMSVRDVVRPQTPSSLALDECEVPLQQLARLKEKLVRHSRAEETAIKRIRDLEMQVFSLKSELDEVQGEKEYMKKQVQEQVVLISDLQIRLDEQRIRAEHIERQTNTSLEARIYDLQSEIRDLREKIKIKDKTIQHQVQQLKDTQEQLADAEKEISLSEDDEIIVAMQKELEALRAENVRLKNKISTESQIVPNLLDNILSDKNTDIEKLRSKLDDTEKLLDEYLSLKLDRRDLQMLSNLRSQGTSLEQVLSIIDLSQPEQMRRAEVRHDSLFTGSMLAPQFKRRVNETVLLGASSEPEISEIERAGPSAYYSLQTPLGKGNSTEIGKLLHEKRVHFEDATDKLHSEALKVELEQKNQLISKFELKLKVVNELQEKISNLQTRLDNADRELIEATKTYEKEQEEMSEKLTVLGIQLAEKKLLLTEYEKKIDMLEQDSKRKDDMYMDLAREKRDLQQIDVVNEKDRQIAALTQQIGVLNENRTQSLGEIDDLKAQIAVLEEKIVEHEIYERNVENLESERNLKLTIDLGKNTAELRTVTEQNLLLTKDLGKITAELYLATDQNKMLTSDLGQNAAQLQKVISEKDTLTESLNKATNSLKELSEKIKMKENELVELQNEIKSQKDIIFDRDCMIEVLNEDLRRYQNELCEFEDKINNMKVSSDSEAVKDKRIKEQETKIKDQEEKIEELAKEQVHLQDLVSEKSKILDRMVEDNNKLHANLLTIQKKMKENGNVLDLGNRLREEQKKTASLMEDIHTLKAKLLSFEGNAVATSMDNIAGKLKKELDCSAQIDSNILSAVSDQSLSSISETQDIEVYRRYLKKYKALNKQLLNYKSKIDKENATLEHQCAQLQQNVVALQFWLEKERKKLQETEIEDAKVIEQLRIHLDSAVDARDELHHLLSDERLKRKTVEEELAELKAKGNSESTESTKYKNLPSKEAIELEHVRERLESVQKEKEQLISDARLLKQTKTELESTLKNIKLQLEIQNGFNKSLEEKLEKLTNQQAELTQQLILKKIELEQKVGELERDKILMDELEQETAHLKKQKSELMTLIKSQGYENTGNVSEFVPEVIQNAIKELQEKTEENKRNMEYIEKVQNEKRFLENQLLKFELKSKNNNNLPYRELIARSDYLFAKSLKLESVRKSLIWQKRYLVDYLQSHQTHCLIEPPVNVPHEQQCLRHTRDPINHFRSAVLVVISIVRMKFLVKRWHTGIRIAEKVNSRYHSNQIREDPVLKYPINSAAQFQVGQPVSIQHFTANLRAPSATLVPPATGLDNNLFFGIPPRTTPALNTAAPKDLPWSGASPPSKEPRSKFKTGTTSITDNAMPLKAPQLLAQFAERFDQIQEKLSLALDSNQSTMDIVDNFNP